MAQRSPGRFFSVLALFSLSATGCAWIDDTSDDNYHYKSSPHMPLTITLVDTRTDEEIWSRDIPVGTGLKMSFSQNGKSDDPYGHSNMKWKVTGIADTEGERYGRLIVPTRAVRRIDVDVRESVELYQPVATPARSPEPMPETAPEPVPEPEMAPEPMPEPPAEETMPVEPEEVAQPAPTEPEPTEPELTEAEIDDTPEAEDDLELPPPPPPPAF